MALRATVYKTNLQLTDMDRQVFGQHSLQLACHPSETEERLMVRLLAFALEACEGLAFGRGISSDDEATIWQHDLSGALRLWVEVGLPDERLLRRASNRADHAVLYAYGGRGVAVWWEQNREALARLTNLRVVELPQDATRALAETVGRNMDVQITVQDGAIWASVGERTIEIAPRELQASVR